MYSKSSLINWLFFDSIFGVLIIGGLVYLILKNIKTSKSNTSLPIIIAGTIVWVGAFTLPSIPRYYFEEKVMLQLKGNNGIKIVEKVKSRELAEPLTWFYAPVKSIVAIMPGDVLDPGFNVYIFDFKTAPIVAFVDADCKDNEVSVAKPDKEGILRVVTNTPVKMSQKEVLWFCKLDWSKEKIAVNQ